MEKISLSVYIQKELERIGELFDEKQQQYAMLTTEHETVDELSNFRTGALLLWGNAENPSMYDAGKSYLAKHIAFLYDHGIDTPKAAESWGDVAVYALILKYMAEAEQEQIQL